MQQTTAQTKMQKTERITPQMLAEEYNKTRKIEARERMAFVRKGIYDKIRIGYNLGWHSVRVELIQDETADYAKHVLESLKADGFVVTKIDDVAYMTFSISWERNDEPIHISQL